MTHFDDELHKVEGEFADVVERKVKAAGTAATVVGFVTTLLAVDVFHGTVPDWATAGVGALVTGALTFGAGWLAKHTPRTPPASRPPVT